MAQAVSITVGGCAAGDGSGLTTCHSTATVVTFNTTALGSLPAGDASAGGAGGQVVTGSVSGQ